MPQATDPLPCSMSLCVLSVWFKNHCHHRGYLPLCHCPLYTTKSHSGPDSLWDEVEQGRVSVHQHRGIHAFTSLIHLAQLLCSSPFCASRHCQVQWSVSFQAGSSIKLPLQTSVVALLKWKLLTLRLPYLTHWTSFPVQSFVLKQRKLSVQSTKLEMLDTLTGSRRKSKWNI